jgi:hypothetical protein
MACAVTESSPFNDKDESGRHGISAAISPAMASSIQVSPAGAASISRVAMVGASPVTV